MDDDECGAVGGMIVKGNRSTRRKPAPVPLCPPQISRDLTWVRTRAAAVGSRWLTSWVMAWPFSSISMDWCCVPTRVSGAVTYCSMVHQIRPTYRNLRTQPMSMLVLLCTSPTTCFGPYWRPSSGGLQHKTFEDSYCIRQNFQYYIDIFIYYIYIYVVLTYFTFYITYVV
jgi:hypothetical protein